MATASLTEEFLLTHTGAKKLASITSLDLRGLGLKHLDPHCFQCLPQLEVLDVSENHLREIPTNIGLPLLRELNCSDNQLNSLGFVKQFPELQDLYVEGNGLEYSERFIVGALCPNIKHVDKTMGTTLRKMVENIRGRTMPHVEKEWDRVFADKYTHGLPREEACGVKQQLVESVMKDVSFTRQNSFKQFMVKLICEQLVNDVQSGVYSTPAKKLRLSSPLESEEEEEEPPVFTTLRNHSSNLSPISDYEPEHFLRCHFGDKEAKKQKMKDTDHADDITKVWHGAFEPDPQHLGNQLLILNSPGEGLLNMVFSQSTGHLVAGCDEGCYAWKIDQSRNVNKHREPSLELVLPGVKDKMVDGLTLVSDELVASKPAHQGCLFLWTLSTPLVSNRRSTKCAVTTVQPLIVLDWSHTDVEFIIPGARNGLLACGDVDGRIWLYNLEKYKASRKVPTMKQTAKPSRVSTEVEIYGQWR